MVPSKGIPETVVLSLGYASLDVMHNSSRLQPVDVLMPFCPSVYDGRRLASVLVGFG